MKVRIAYRTHEGVVRDHNEDNFILFADLTRRMTFPGDPLDTVSVGPDGTLMVVADGMGGMNAGEVASATAVQTVNEKFGKDVLDRPPQDVKGLLFDTIVSANQAIAKHGKENPDTDGMGTTLIIGWVRDGHFYCAWVGDRRAYIYRPGTGLVPVSKDHSLVQEWVDAKRMTYEEAFHHPQNHIVTQSLGDGSRELEPGYAVRMLQDGDRILLCSDGLNGMLEDPQIEAILAREGLLPEIAAQLVSAANAAGGHDNITVILAEVEDIPAELPMVPEAKPLAPATVDFGVPAVDNGNMTNSIFARLESIKSSKNRWKLLSLALMTFILTVIFTIALIKLTDSSSDLPLEKEKIEQEPSTTTSSSVPPEDQGSAIDSEESSIPSSASSRSERRRFRNPVTQRPDDEDRQTNNTQVQVETPLSRALDDEKRKDGQEQRSSARTAGEGDPTQKSTPPGGDSAGSVGGIPLTPVKKPEVDTTLNPSGGGNHR